MYRSKMMSISFVCIYSLSNVYERVLEHRMRNITESLMQQSQSGFRRGGSIQDHIFILKQLTEQTKSTGKKICVPFLDIEKALDRVPRDKAFNSVQICTLY